MNYVYLLRCSDGSYYTGWTNRLQHRLQTHQSGNASKYTRARLPVKPVLFLACADASVARSVEGKIKWLSRAEKIRILESPETAMAYCHKWNEGNPPQPQTPLPHL